MSRSIPLFLLPFLFLIFIAACGGETTEKDDTGVGDDVTVPDDADIDTDEGLPPIDDAVPTDDAPITGDDDVITEGDPDIPDVDNGLDSDGDGIPDAKEGTGDTDGDGTPDHLDDDCDGDGIPDSIEAPGGVTVDTDGDTIPDYKDTDSDGDTVPDALEGTGDADGDGTSNYRDKDSDNDGISDEKEAGNDPDNPVDSDSDTTPDYLDKDSDGDGIPDIYEGDADIDGDGIKNYLDDDSDGDGILDSVEAGADPSDPVDSDGDDLYDFKDADSDNDGLSDAKEQELSTDPTKADSDGDGISDMAEYAYGSDPTDPLSAIPAEDFYVVLPYQDPAQQDDLQFTTDVGMADVIMLIDLSPSMSDEINNLKLNMGSVINNILLEIPDTHFGLVAFATWEAPYPYLLAQRVTDNASLMQGALNLLNTTDIGWYEPQEEALYQAATGEGLTAQIRLKKTRGTPTYSYDDISIAAVTDCSSGIGGVCFREEALPIFLMVTDEPFQGYELPVVPDDYYTGGIDGSWYVGTGHSLTEATGAMNAKNAKFIGIDSSADILEGPNPYYTQVATDTGSQNTLGEPFVYKINPDGTVPGGTDLAAQVVDAVTELTNTIALALSTGKTSVTNSYGVETKNFIKAIDFASADPADGVQEVGGDLMVDPGTQVTYDITFQNDFYDNQDPEAHLFKAKILVIGGGVTLDTRDVFIIVPGKIPNSGQES